MALPTCDTTLGTVRADYCTPGTAFGRFDKFRFTRVGDGLTNASALSEWESRIDNDAAAPSTGDYPIRELNVIGSMDEPEQTEIEISLNRRVFSQPTFTVNLEVDDVGATNYAFMQDLIDNNGGTFAAWLEGHGFLYGGNDGIEGSLNLRYSVPAARTELTKILGTFVWTGSMPDRIATPFV